MLIRVRMKLTKRERWLMEKAFYEGIHSYHETFEEWISQPIGPDETLEEGLLSLAPKETSTREIIP